LELRAVREVWVGSVVEGLTGMPVEVRMMASSVWEKMRDWEVFAEANLVCMRVGRASGSSRIIFIGVYGCCIIKEDVVGLMGVLEGVHGPMRDLLS
jgi:hypothetical protein